MEERDNRRPVIERVEVSMEEQDIVTKSIS